MTLTLGEIARHIDAELYGDPDCKIHGINTLQKASQGEISFFSNRRYAAHLKTTSASAVILGNEDRELCRVSMLVEENPYLGYARIASLLAPAREHKPGIDKSAHIHSSARINPSASINQNVTVGANSLIAENVYIGAGCVIGDNVEIAANSRLYANV